MKKITLLLFTLVLSYTVKSQNLEVLLLASDDASLLFQNYMTPVMNGMAYGLNNGWYSTAKTHKKLGFDITINANVSIVPKASRTFQFNVNDYKYLTLKSGDSNIQTVIGSNNNSKIAVKIPEVNNFKVAEFNMPDGIGSHLPLNAVPSPMIQASVGMPFNTDISIRFLPKINTKNVDGSMLGFGIKHSLMQYFGSLDILPLNISLFAGYTTMKSTYNLQNVSILAGSNQEAAFKLNAFTIQALASLDFPIITLYGGIGYDKGSSTLKINGTYELTYDIADSSGNLISTVTEPPVTDPINMNFKANGVRGTIGARLNLAFFKIYGDYTIKEYNTISTGITFSFR